MATTTHGDRLRRQQMTYKLLERLDRLVSVPALWWLRTMRNAVWVTAIVCWLMSRRMDSLLLFVVAVALQLMIMQVILVRLLREGGEHDETIKRPYAQMHQIACGLVERLQPACERIEIAGSIRRQRPMIGDIEIVLIPKPLTDLFGEPTSMTFVDLTLDAWPITRIKDGPKYKQFAFAGKTGQTYTVDLFIQPDPATWGVNYMIRTGSADFSHRMVTKHSQGGLMPDGLSIKDAWVRSAGAPLDTPEEEDIFFLWGMDWVAPELRS